MTEIHAFDPDGTPSPGAQTALDNATEGLASTEAVGDAIVTATAPLASEELVAAGIRSTRQGIADYTDRLTPVMNVPARPEGALWPQGFSIDLDAGMCYVFYAGNIDGKPVRRIVRYTTDGKVHDFKDAQGDGINEGAGLTASESIPFWRDGGDLKFLLSVGADGRGRAVYNYTKGSLGDTFTTLGGYRGDFDGNAYITPDSADSVNGVSRLYYYDAEDIKSGTATLLRTVPLQFRAKRRKLQGLTTSGGTTVGVTGPAGGIPGLAAWAPNGNQLFSYEYAPEPFADLVNSAWPGTVADPQSYHREPEGAATDAEGRLHFGSVINNGGTARFVIFRAGDPTARRVPTVPDPETVDTDWQKLELTNPEYFEPWTPGRNIEFRRVGAVVFLRGEVRTLQAGWSGQALGSLTGAGRAVIPAVAINAVQQGSGNGRFAIAIRTNGAVELGRADADLDVQNRWLNLNVTYLAD